MNSEQLKNLLRSYNLKPNFTYGQNFLIDEIILEDIVDAAGVGRNDAVLEIGPGVGNLTGRLAERTGFLLSVEKDPKFLPILKNLKKQHPENFRFEIADALEFDFQSFFAKAGFKSYKVVANIPYYVTGKILQMLLSAKFKPSSITVLTQKEVARNVCAKAGELSVLALSVQLYGMPRLAAVVPAKSFYPAPKVDSAILQIDVLPRPAVELKNEKQFFKVAKACFAGKRKQLHNTLVNNLRLEKTAALKILNDLQISPAARPQELTLKQWAGLAEKVENYQKI